MRARHFTAKTKEKIEVEGIHIMAPGFTIPAGNDVRGIYTSNEYKITSANGGSLFAKVTRKQLIDFKWGDLIYPNLSKK